MLSKQNKIFKLKIKSKMKKIILYASDVAAISGYNKYKEPWQILEFVFKRFDGKNIYNKLKEYFNDNNMELTMHSEKFSKMTKQIGGDDFVKKLLKTASSLKTNKEIDQMTEQVSEDLNKTCLDKIKNVKDKSFFRKSIKSAINKNFGTSSEKRTLNDIEKKLNCKITNNNDKFYMKQMGVINKYKWYLGGRVDGFTDSSAHILNNKMKVVEIKNRRSKWFMKYDPPIYDQIQLQTYLILTKLEHGLLIEQYQSDNSVIKITPYYRASYWDTDIIPKLQEFVNKFVRFIENQSLQVNFFLASSEHKKKSLFEKL